MTPGNFVRSPSFFADTGRSFEYESYAQGVDEIEMLQDSLDVPEEDALRSQTVADLTRSDGLADDDVDDEHGADGVLERGRQLLIDAEARLSAVERALARLDAGNYGICEVCNEPIAPALLAEQPSRSLCAAHESSGS